MNAEWRPTIGHRLLLYVLYAIAWLYQGSVPRKVVVELLKTMGVRGYFQYMLTSTKVIRKLEERFGLATSQFLVGLSSLYIGCGFCCYNHIVAGSLAWFRDEDSLHPLDPYAVSPLFDLTDDEIAERLEDILDGPEHQRLLELALRMQTLYLEEDFDESTVDDDHLRACLWLWRWTTECTIVEGISWAPEEAQPQHPIGHNKKLRKRYDERRTEAGLPVP